ncbi:MAG: hypothetical protein APF80_11470 [Alphaproteobacteria bacterium BRH_c36]|nr:MAG: hypothetical protein APF80_11470 [Alphaproteobacteria bacterium BRH_c36]
MASANFTNYAIILNRVCFAQLIDDSLAAHPSSRCRPSQVAEPVTRLRYSAAALVAPSKMTERRES